MDIFQKHNIHIVGNLESPKTLIFGHGFGLDQTCFQYIIPAFASDFKIVLYDNVGGGMSDINAFSFHRYATIDGYVTDLTELIAALNLKDIIYVGHSVSGMIGLLASLRHPGIFERLVMIGSSPRYLDDPSLDYIGGFDQPALNGFYDAMESNFHAWAAGFATMAMNQPGRPELSAAFANSLQAIRADIAVAVARSIFQLDHRHVLKNVNIPVLILQTADDIAVPAAVSDYLESNIPYSTRVKVYTTGHFPQISAPEEVISGMQSFL
ncbi:alpha/beta fold hydrolase [Chitinophaga dinghuensis]|nr:alpha/beta hydrolase [Chitinophaga dinghuensis]